MPKTLLVILVSKLTRRGTSMLVYDGSTAIVSDAGRLAHISGFRRCLNYMEHESALRLELDSTHTLHPGQASHEIEHIEESCDKSFDLVYLSVTDCHPLGWMGSSVLLLLNENELFQRNELFFLKIRTQSVRRQNELIELSYLFLVRNYNYISAVRSWCSNYSIYVCSANVIQKKKLSFSIATKKVHYRLTPIARNGERIAPESQ